MAIPNCHRALAPGLPFLLPTIPYPGNFNAENITLTPKTGPFFQDCLVRSGSWLGPTPDADGLFPPYNAIQIEEILQKRVGVGFNEGVFEAMVVPRIAAIAAQEQGDIRKAINLLRATGEIASSPPCPFRRDTSSWLYAIRSGSSVTLSK